MLTKEPTFHAPQSLHPLESPCCTHAYYTHKEGTLRCERLCVCVTKSMLFLPLHFRTSRACTQFRGYLKNQRQTKTLPPPTPPPIQRGSAEKQSDIKKNEERKSTSERDRLNTGLDKAVKKGGAEERRWMKGERTLHRRSLKTWIECMCLLSQLITLYRGHGLTLYTTHTRSSGKRWDVSSNCNSFWNFEWISFAIPPYSVVCVAWCSNSSGKERLSLTPYSSIVHTTTLQSVTGFSMNCARGLGLYTQTLLSYGPCVTTCVCVYVYELIYSICCTLWPVVSNYTLILQHIHKYRNKQVKLINLITNTHIHRLTKDGHFAKELFIHFSLPQCAAL